MNLKLSTSRINFSNLPVLLCNSGAASQMSEFFALQTCHQFLMRCAFQSTEVFHARLSICRG